MKTGIYIIAIFTFFVQIENREEFEGLLHEKREKGAKRRKRKRVIKHTLNTFMELK